MRGSERRERVTNGEQGTDGRGVRAVGKTAAAGSKAGRGVAGPLWARFERTRS